MNTLHSSFETLPSLFDSYFQTTDIDLAAYLEARAYGLLRIKRTEGSMMFMFPADAALSAEAFYLGATISAKLLLHAARKLETLRKQKTDEQYFA